MIIKKAAWEKAAFLAYLPQHLQLFTGELKSISLNFVSFASLKKILLRELTHLTEEFIIDNSRRGGEIGIRTRLKI